MKKCKGTSPHPSREGEDKLLPAEGLLASGPPTSAPSRISAMAFAVSFPVTAAGPRRILTCFPDAADCANIFPYAERGTTLEGKVGDFFEKVHRIVAKIPFGAVMTYGQIAAIAGNPRASRAVGYALRVKPVSGELPWHRVVNSKGEISTRRTMQGDDDRSLQRVLLESEGVEFSSSGRIDLTKYCVPL